MYQPAMKGEMEEFEARKKELENLIATAEAPPPLLHPNMSKIYRERVSALAESLARAEDKAEAAEVLRTLIDQITLVPDGEELAIELRGDLAGILRLGKQEETDFLSEAGALDDLLSQLSLVAGAGFEPATFRL